MTATDTQPAEAPARRGGRPRLPLTPEERLDRHRAQVRARVARWRARAKAKKNQVPV